jgi:hypothetical protein
MEKKPAKPNATARTTPEKVILYQDDYGATYEVELPLTSKVNPEDIRDKLGLPSYIDLDYFPMKNALVTIWAALNAAELHERYPEAYVKKVGDKPIPVLMFGGAAVKIHCEHANGSSPLVRNMKDMDFIVPKKQGSDFNKLLLGMGKAFGTRYTSFRTKSDMIFNGMRQGERYRIRTINGMTEDGTPTVTVLDIFCDSINLRHKVDVKEAFEKYKENLYTIGLENLILSKCQFILDFPKEKLENCGCDYRILPYPYYASDMVVLGMEEKDMKDVCAIFLGHPIGKGSEQIDADRMQKALEKDSKLALTVTLNLRNLVERPEIPTKWLRKTEVATVLDRIKSLLDVLPKVDKKWNKPWWNTAVETPMI